MNGTYQLLVLLMMLNYWGKNLCAIKRNITALVNGSKEDSVEADAKKTNNMLSYQ
jgi:hypothetical protein